MRYRTVMAYGVMLLVLLSLQISCTKSGQIPYGDFSQSEGDVSAPSSEVPVDAGIDTQAPPVTDTQPKTVTPKGPLIVGCRGVTGSFDGAPMPMKTGDNVNSLLSAIRGSELLAQCDATPTPVKVEEIAGVANASPQDRFQWLGLDVDETTGAGEVLASYWENGWNGFFDANNNWQPAARSEYRVYNEALTTVKSLQPRAPYFTDNGRRLTLLQDLDQDGYRDFVAITKEELGVNANYYLEEFPGSAQGLATQSKWQTIVPVTQPPIKLIRAPLAIAASPAGEIGVAYKNMEMGNVVVHVAQYSPTGSGGVSILNVNGLGADIGSPQSCGMALFEFNQQLEVALCLRLGATSKIVVGNKMSPLINFATLPATTFVPLGFRVLEGNIVLMAAGFVSAFTPMNVVNGLWNQPLWTYKLDAGEEPLDVIRDDVDENGQIETLIKVRRAGMTRFLKIYLENNTAMPCRTIEFHACEYPQNG